MRCVDLLSVLCVICVVGTPLLMRLMEVFVGDIDDAIDGWMDESIGQRKNDVLVVVRC